MVSRTQRIAPLILLSMASGLLLYLYAMQLDRSSCRGVPRDPVTVIKAKDDLLAGTPLTKDHIIAVDIPEKFLPPNPLLEQDLQIYLGTPLAVNLEEGAMILTSDFTPPR